MRRLPALVLVLVAAAAVAEEPSRPPWQRYLQGENARKAAQQQKKLAQLQEAGRLTEALPVAEALAQLRRKLQGADHWQTVNARMEAGVIRRLLRQGKPEQEAHARSFGLHRRAVEMRKTGRYREAQPLLEEVLAIRRKVLGKEHPQTASSYSNLAMNQYTQRKYREAEEGLHKALAIRRKVLGEEHPQTALSYNNLAGSQEAQSKYQEAEENHRRALAIRSKVLGEENPDTAQSYNNLAANHNSQGKYAQAEEGYRKALAIYRKVFGEEHLDTARCYNNLAHNQDAQAKYVQAEEGYGKALAIHRKLLGEEHPETADSYNNLAACHCAQSKHARAEEGYLKALAIYRKVFGEEHLDTARCYNNLAANQKAQGQYALAEEGFRKALAIHRKIAGEEHPHTAMCYNNLAHNQKAQGKYVLAEEGFRKALALCRKVLGEEHPQTATCYGNLASNYQAQGQYQQAEEGFLEALTIQRKVLGEEHPSTAGSYSSLACNQQALGNYAQAEEGYRKTLALRRKVLGEMHSSTAQSYNNLATDQHLLGKYAEAEEGFRKALDICRAVLGEEHAFTAHSYNNLAANQYHQGKYAEAEAGIRQALAIRRKVLGEEHPDTACSYHIVAVLERNQGKYAQAEENHRKALAIRRRALGDDHPDTAETFSELAFSQNVQGKYHEAETFWSHAADSFRKARLQSAAGGLDRVAFSSQRSPLPSLAAVLARNGKLERAWQRFEESLSPGTWDDFSVRLRRPQAQRDQQTQLAAHIQTLTERIEQAGRAGPSAEQGRQREALLGQLRQAYDELAALRRELEKKYGPSAGQVFGRQRIQASLPADTALLGWLDIAAHPRAVDPGGEHWAILLRSAGEPLWIRLSGSGDKGAWTDADTEMPSQLRTALQRPASDWQTLAQRLRKQRLQPLAQHLDGVHHLIVLPSTALAGVPLEIIAEGYTVSYAPSGTLYAHLRQQPASTGKGLLALADPVFDPPARPDRPPHDDWPRLPGTRFEVAALERLFAPEPIQRLLDSEASEPRLNELAQSGELGRYRYIHLATHGEVDDTFPLRSGVILARDNLANEKQRANLLASGQAIPDGRLTAEEVLQRWRLDSDLVTLSACQTALGKFEQGEGYVGFAQALILAGSRSVCLSLWKVDDTATALLMERFYQNLLGKRQGLKQPMSKAAALTEAKRWLRQLSGEEARQRAVQLSRGGDRGKGRKLQPLRVQTADKDARERPYAHPYYWAAFVLIGQADG